MSKSRGSSVEHDHDLAPTKEDLRPKLSQGKKKSLHGFRYAGEVNLEAAEWVEDVREGLRVIGKPRGR
jgi:hypothetical protein